MTGGAAGGPDRFARARALLEGGVREKAYPAGVVLAARGGEIVLHAAAGEAHLSSVFDVASLTKPLVASLFFVLAQGGRLQPDDRVGDLLPRAAGSGAPGAESATYLQLLSHTSGLPAWRPFYEEPAPPAGTGEEPPAADADRHDRIVEAALSTPLAHPPGSACVYSDIGYIVLGRAIELSAFAPLDRLFRREIAEPLGMADTGYTPALALSECETGRLMSTGWSSVRGKEKVGEVDDENAAAMGGVSGHAGVFSTAHDLFLFSREFLRALRGEGRVLSRSSAGRMARRAEVPPGCPRTPGWDTPSAQRSQAGRHFPAGSVGHLGFTGCSLWIDVPREITVVFLTNRVYYGQQNDGIKRLRPLLHDAVMEDILAE